MAGGAGELAVRLQPRAGRDEVVGERGGRILIRVAAPALDGRANVALCALIAERTGVAMGSVSIVRGLGSRDKTVRVAGRSSAELRASLGVG